MEEFMNFQTEDKRDEEKLDHENFHQKLYENHWSEGMSKLT
jgi:hypothetical protein